MLRVWAKGNEKMLRGYLWLKDNTKALIINQRGDVTTVGILGWAAVVITLIVTAHGLLTGWLPTFIEEKIFDRASAL